MGENSNYFFVVLPSNVSDSNYPNRPNQFRVHLPKPIQFQGNQWMVALYSILYPRSWAQTVGTVQPQWIDIHSADSTFRIDLPPSSQQTPEELRDYLRHAIGQHHHLVIAGSADTVAQHFRKVKRAIPDEADNQSSDQQQSEILIEGIGGDSPAEKKVKRDPDPLTGSQRLRQRGQQPERPTTNAPVPQNQPPSPSAPSATNRRNGETAERAIAKNEEKAGDPAQNQTVSSSQRLHQVRGEEARKAKEEEEKRIREAAAKKAKEDEEKRAKEAAAKKAKEEEEKRAKEAAAKKAKEDEEKRVREAAIKKSKEEEEKRVREAAAKKAKEDEEKRAREAAAKKAKEDEEKRASEPAGKKAKEEEAKALAAKKAKEEEEKRKTKGAEKDAISSQQDGISHGQRAQLLREEERKKKEKESAAKAKEEKEEATTQGAISHAQRLHQMREQEEKKQKEEAAEQPKKVPTSPVQQETISHGQRLHQMREQEEKKQKEAAEVLAIEFDFSREIGRFLMRFNDPSIKYISLSEQLAYVLGFPDRHRVNNGETAKYGPDMNGGFGSFAVYCNGLTRSVIMGNSLSSMLRIVAVEGTYGQMVERIYDHPMFIPVLPREINEIEVELRLMNGAHVPFEFGSVIVILAFKRVINF